MLVSLQQIDENSDTFGFVVVGEFEGDPSSQFPYFSELFKTTIDGRIFTLKSSANILELSFRPLPRLPKVPGRRNLMVDLFVLHLPGLYRPI